MSAVNLTNVTVLDNPAAFLVPFQFEISYECVAPLKDGNSQEFVRVGYYVNNDYDDEQLREEPPQKVLIDKIQRNLLSDKPTVTKFPINFYPENSEIRDQAPAPAPDLVDAVEENEKVPPLDYQSNGEGL